MGLSIYYSGSFRRNASLSEMIEEVKDIAEVYKWEYTIYENQFSENTFVEASKQDIYGISFTPPKCETIFLSFLSNGKMYSAAGLDFFGETEDKPEQKYSYMLSVKTQYAGVEAHKIIIHLFQYLDKKYFQGFKMIDEGKYWETGDEKLLQEIFNRYNALMQNFSSALENYPMNVGETVETYFERLIKQMRGKEEK